jgi:hypothetical protein
MKPPLCSEMIAPPDSGMISPLEAGVLLVSIVFSLSRLESRFSRLISPQAIAGQVDAVCVVDEAIEDGVSVGGMAYKIVPGRHGKLAGDNRGATTVAIFEDFQKIVTGLLLERFQPQSSRIRSWIWPKVRCSLA